MTIDKIFAFESTRIRQREAPLFIEREQFLTYLFDLGVSLNRLKAIAAVLLQIVRLLQLESLRIVDRSELVDAGIRWCNDPQKIRGKYKKSADHFCTVAMRWFRFADVIGPLVTVQTENDTMIEDFHNYLSVIRGFSAISIRNYTERSARFVSWATARQPAFAQIRLADVEDYLKCCQEAGFRPHTISSICNALRELFRYASSRRLNKFNIASNIVGPRISRYGPRPKGPEWKDVRRLLDHGFGTTLSELRAAALLSLCAIYALRSCEVVALRLADLDWISETLTVRRAKSGKIQQFPLQFEVGETILRYLRQARPRCACRNLFVTTNPPFRPMMPSTTYRMLSERLKRLGIESESFGVHALRHSCATRLLREGSSLKDIAGFLGHSDMSSVSIYAKYDSRLLRQVAEFSLAGVK
jgi:integrase/recombinase XerD